MSAVTPPRLAALPLAAALVCSACGGGPSFTVEPTVAPNPNPAVPLAAVVTFQASEPVATTLSVSDETHFWELEYDASHDPSKGLPVLGMRPNRKHQISVAVRNAQGAERSSAPLDFTTPPLPEVGVDFPPIEVVVSKPEKMEPGVTLFNPRRRKVGRGQEIADFNAAFGMLMALDSAGEPVWYYRSDSRVSDFEVSRNGNIIYCTEDYRLIEIDWLGNTVHQWYAKNRPEGPAENAIPVDALTFHHEIAETPDGNILALSSEWKEIDDYYTDEYDQKAPRKRQKVMGDVIVEVDRKTGAVVWEWRAFDHMDPFRIGYETFSGYWERRGFPGVIDWSHANNLRYDESDDSIVVNFRYQAAAMKIDRATKEIKWIFGEPTGWGDLADKVLKPEGDVRWPFHQHSPSPTPNGTLLIFDNGNYQARPFRKPVPVPDTFSRAVEYAIDEKNGTVRELWQSEHKDENRVISIAMGDVDWLPRTQNILVAYGALLTPESIPKTTWESSSRQGFSQWTRLREYVRRNPPEVVYEIVLDSGKPDLGWTLFGAERIDHIGP
jgi:arylsulfate sulfotransferase